MQDNFNIHNWRFQQALEEYKQLLEPVPTPISEDDVASLWTAMAVNTNLRADIIAAAAPTAGIASKSLNWVDVKAELRGLIVGWFNKHPKEYYYYKGYVQSN